MAKQPKQLINSEHERAEHDAYYTAPWLTEILLRYVKVRKYSHIFEPAAGRGDMIKVIRDKGGIVSGLDIAPPKKLVIPHGIIKKGDFLASDFKFPRSADAVINNPPFGDLAQKFVTRAVTAPQIRLSAFLMRSLWNTAPGGRGVTKGSRSALFSNGPAMLTKRAPFAYEIVITERPTWDWWYVTKAQAEENNKPFHSYSWFVWSRDWTGPSTQFWEGR